MPEESVRTAAAESAAQRAREPAAAGAPQTGGAAPQAMRLDPRAKVAEAAAREAAAAESAEDQVPEVRRARRTRASDFSRPYLATRFQLYSDTAQILFERTYPRIDNSLYMLCVVIPSFGTEEQSRRDQQALEDIFQSVESELADALENNLDQMRRSQVPKEAQMTSYDHKRIYDVPLRSPYARRYLALFSRYDQLIAHLDALWINGLLPQEHRIRIGQAWERRLRNVVRIIYNLRLDALHRAGESARIAAKRARPQSRDTGAAEPSASAAAPAADPVEELRRLNDEAEKPVEHTDVDTSAEDRSPAQV